MTSTSGARSNYLLAALPSAAWERWLTQLARVDMPLGQVVHESGSTRSHVYFPLTSIVSSRGAKRGPRVSVEFADDEGRVQPGWPGPASAALLQPGP